MLVLSRRINEEIVIDNTIRIQIVKASGGRVRLRIEAPRDITIRRLEQLACESGEAEGSNPLSAVADPEAGEAAESGVQPGLTPRALIRRPR